MDRQHITSLLSEICEIIRFKGVYARYNWCRDQLSQLLDVYDSAELNDIILNISRYSYWKDAEKHYQWCTPQFSRLLAVEPDAITGKMDDDLAWNSEAKAIYQAADQQVLGQNDRTEVECHSKLPDGTTRQLKTKLYPVRSETGQVIGILGVTREAKMPYFVPEFNVRSAFSG